MKIIKNPYFDKFRCIAGQCPDSCCKEWSVAVDNEAAAFYRSLPGSLGQRLRQVLTEEDGDTVMAIENGRCPMWRSDGLCRIQAELGHDALCKTCREFPRLTHDYGDFQEWGLELSCPAAAEILLNSPPLAPVIDQVPGGSEPEYDGEAMKILLRTRMTMYSILESDRPAGEVLALALMYGYHAQAELDGGGIAEFDADAALDEARNFSRPGQPETVLEFYKQLEILTPEWSRRLDTPHRSPWSARHLLLARYFVERYWLQAVSDYDLVGRVKLAVVSCLAVRILGGDTVQTAQLYSKEIENDPENVEALLDAAYANPAFTDDRLLGMLLETQ